MFGSSFYFFDVVQSAQFVDPQVVHLKTDCQRLCPQSKAVSRPDWLESSQSGLDQGHFRRSGRTEVASDRNPLTVGHHHQFATFAAFGFSDGMPSFFAAAKLPLIKVSSPSINVRHTCNEVPSSCQRRNRGQQVDGLESVAAKSGQPAPEPKSQRMPSNSSRLER